MPAMTDSFALLNEPRRPWIEPDSLQAKFLALSAEVHPDRFHNAAAAEKQAATQRYTELNAAYNCLREPKERLLHLLTLERGSKPKDVQQLPAGTMELFSEVAELCRKVDGFLAERAKVSSPLLRVQMFERSQGWTGDLSALQQRIGAERDQLMAELRVMNAAWESAPPVGSPARPGALPLERLEELYRAFSYVTRWTAQLQERLVQLSI